MQQLNNFIVEKLKIDKDTRIIRERDREDSAEKGAVIEMDLNNLYCFMMYDPNSGIVSCFGCDSASQLAKEWSIDEKDARRLCDMNKGESYIDESDAIITLIS